MACFRDGSKQGLFQLPALISSLIPHEEHLGLSAKEITENPGRVKALRHSWSSGQAPHLR